MPIEATHADIKRRCSARERRKSVSMLPLFAIGIFAIPLSACQSLSQEEGFLPNTIRSATSILKPGDYPDLRKIPEVPRDLPTQKNWADLQAKLDADARVVQANPGAKPVTSDEIDQTWAASERQVVDSDPASKAVTQTDAESEAWASAARAKMEADIARLPPT